VDQLQLLTELEALKQLKARYFLYIDTKRWDEWLALFTADAALAWDTAVSAGGRDGHTSRFAGLAEIKQDVVLGILDPTTPMTCATAGSGAVTSSTSRRKTLKPPPSSPRAASASKAWVNWLSRPYTSPPRSVVQPS